MIEVSSLPALNAALNAAAAVFLIIGFLMIRRRNIRAHRICMLTAFGFSTLFFASYLIYHYTVGNVHFEHHGIVRPIYFTILITHVVLAAVLVPLALVTLYRALSKRFSAHRRIARFTWPIWVYVSITGVIVYVMLYRLYPPAKLP